MQDCEMNLGDRGRRDGLHFEMTKQLEGRLTQGLLDQRHGLIGWKWRDAILQQGELVRNVGWDQVTAGGQHLAKLDKDGAQ